MTIIETKSRSNFISVLIYGLFSLLCLFGTPIAVFRVLSEKTDEFYQLIPVFVVLLFTGVLCLRMLLWLIKGKESLSVLDGSFIIKKTGTFWIKKRKAIQLNQIKKITINRSFIEENSPSDDVHDFSRQTIIFRIQNTGRIKIIDKEFNTFKFLDNLYSFQAEALIIELNSLVEGKKN
ncbi:MAG: hypothetical protein IT221_01065 [Fluviicola sp.]|nr:hypothetical protein [Fluviicola sp.]